MEVAAPPLKRATLGPSRSSVRRLAGLFALDAFAGGFVVQTLIAFWLIDRFDATTATVGALFAAIGVIQTISFLVAPIRLAALGLSEQWCSPPPVQPLPRCRRAFAPASGGAGLLLVRSSLSQMDVPTSRPTS